MTEIHRAENVTEAHIEEACELRGGIGSAARMDWDEVIDRLESSGDDWGTDMLSPAIRYLMRETNRRLRDEPA